MKKSLLKAWMAFLIVSLYATSCCFSQNVNNEIMKTLGEIAISKPPFFSTKRTKRPRGNWFPKNVPNIPDELCMDLQGEKVFSHAYGYPDLEPSLYWRYQVPNMDFQLGVLCFGGVTDFETIRIIIVDKSGNVKDCMDVAYGEYDMTVLQYSLTTDYKLITYRLVPTSSETILFDDLYTGKVPYANCYRIDTTYRISNEGKFEKEGEVKYPAKNYTGKQLYEKNVWEQ